MADMQITATNGRETVLADGAFGAISHGAEDCLTKPYKASEILVRNIAGPESQQYDRELRFPRERFGNTHSFGNMVTRSEKMKDLIRQVRQVADTDVTVLIQGESGTGKELIAQALHFSSMRAAGPFIAINCSAIPENLLESELFGHEKGSFTGATKQKHGRFEDAHTGTLFLDEIGDITSTVQAKLLRVLQEKKFERVGSNSPVTVDTRVVVATNRNLELMIHQGNFREDLFYRLNVFPIELPPLRDRLEDVPLLAEHFIRQNADLSNARVKYIAPGVISDMMNYAWRGNIRELENLIKRAIIKTSGDTITSVELPATPRSASPPPAPDIQPTVNLETPFKFYLSTIVHDAEEKYLLRMLRLNKGNINHVAKLMDLDRKTVYRKMTEHSIDPSLFRAQ